MKLKIPIIVIAVFALVIMTLWFFLSGGETPLTDSNLPSGSPFGSGGEAVNPVVKEDFEGEVPALQASTPSSSEEKLALFKLSTAPVSGFVPLARSSTTVVRYVDRATGHIFDVLLSNLGREVIKTRVTNNTLAQIYEALFRPDGNAVLMRSLDDADTIKNLSLTLTAPKASSSDGLYTVSLTSLRGVIDSPSVSGNNLVYVSPESTTIASSAFNGEQVRNIWNSGAKFWRTGRIGANTLVFTKPSADIPGYAYSLTPQGSTSKLLGPLNGLAVLGNPTGTTLLYSYFDNDIRLFTKDVAKNTTSEIVPATLAEKCVWSIKGRNIIFCGAPVDGFANKEPDNWYKGITHYSDFIWRFDTLTQTATLIMEPTSTFGVSVDVSSPALSPDEKYLVFVNRRDQSLWAVTLY